MAKGETVEKHLPLFGRENAALGGRACITWSHVMTLLEKLYIMQCAERLALGFPTGLFISYSIIWLHPQLSTQLSIHYTKLLGASAC